MLLPAGGPQQAAQGVLLAIGIILIALIFGALVWHFFSNIIEDPRGAQFNLLLCVGVPVVVITLIGTAISGNVRVSAIVGLVVGLVWWMVAVIG